jgi:hypothetical protein
MKIVIYVSFDQKGVFIAERRCFSYGSLKSIQLP